NLTEMQLEYDLKNFAAGTGTEVNTSDTNLIITGLQAETEYALYYRKVCAPFDTADVDTLFFTSLVSCPEPYNISLVEATFDSVAITWDYYGPGSSFIVEFDSAGFVQGTGDLNFTSTNSFSVVGLDRKSVV